MANKSTPQFKNKREMDAAAFSQAAYVLDQAKQNIADKDMCERALKYNQLLWSIIQSDVSGKTNALPDEIKANLMSLSIFVDKQTARASRNRPRNCSTA